MDHYIIISSDHKLIISPFDQNLESKKTDAEQFEASVGVDHIDKLSRLGTELLNILIIFAIFAILITILITILISSDELL